MRGGKRPGAGRPQGSVSSYTLEAQALRQYILQEVIKKKADIVETLIDNAAGGDIYFMRELLDRILGKGKDLLPTEKDEEELAQPHKSNATEEKVLESKNDSDI